MRKVLLTIGLVVVAVSLCATACAPQGASNEKVFKVGVVGPFTGPNARTGEQFQDAVNFAFEAIDYKIGDYKIEVVWVDSESDPEKAARAYEGAILKDKIQAGLVNWHSSVSVAIMDVAAKHQIPHFLGMGATSVINEKYLSDPEKYGYYVGKAWASPSKYTPAYVDVLEDAIARGEWDPGEKRVVVCSVDNDWGRSFNEALKSGLVEHDWTVVAEDYFKDGETEFYPLVGKWRDLDPQLVVINDSTVSGSAAVKQIKEVGLDVFVISENLSRGAAEWYDMAGEASDYGLDMIGAFVKPEGKAFVKAFEEKYDYEPTFGAGGLVYDSTSFFIKVCERTIEKYGELNSENFYKVCTEEVATGKLTYTEGAVMPEYKFTPETMPDPVVGPDHFTMAIVQLFDGEGVIVWPPAFREQNLAIPPWLQD
jgi:branched-chain amino acid transport system substrate-binding protein